MKIKILFCLAGSILLSGIVKAQWDNRYNGQGDFSDKFTAVLTDASGNIFLAGSTVNPGTNQDLLLVKLDGNGDTVWSTLYNGSGNGPDEALDMCFDASGNIYTTGFQKGTGTGNDFITIKYNPSGVIEWTASYNYSSNESDQSNSVVVDASGNVYIAGQSDSDPSANNNDDYVLIKYDGNGAEQWANRIDGFGNSTDRPTKILLAPNGNIVVTGRSNNGFDDDYMTLSFTPSGTQVWSQLFDRLHTDRATDMEVDPANGNIFVTGRSGNGNDYDYATVCYSPSGIQQWAVFYDYVEDDRATFIGLDNAGNIYVTGQSDIDPSGLFNYDITTVKYNASGVQQWVQTWSSSAANDDSPGGFFVDGAGNCFVAGLSDTDPGTGISNDFTVIKYTSIGVQQWVNTFNRAGVSNDVPYGIAGDGNGNVIVTGYSENIPQRDGVTIKYSSGGSQQWVKYFNGVGDNSDNSHAIAVDASNNIFIAGYTVEYETDRNFSLSKIDANGITQWIKELNGTSTASTDEAQSVAIDGAGNIIVAGYTKNSGTSSDVTVAKYNQQGDTLWVRYYNYPVANESDRGYAMALDANNNVYVTGRSDSDPSINSNDDVITIKYNSLGVLQWVQRYNGTGNGTDGAKAIKVTAAGNVYVAGRSFNGSNLDYILIKYNTAGTQQWVTTYDGGTGDDECNSMAIDNSENIFLTGSSKGANGVNSDAATEKISSSGIQQWVKRFGGAAGGNDEGKSITLDQAGNVIVAGTTDADTSSTTLNSDIFTIKYDGNSAQQWVEFYNGTASANDDAAEVIADGQNNIYITGQADNGAGGIQNYDFITLKYAPTGALSGTLTYNGPGNNSDVANTLLLRNNTLYVTGGSYGISSQRDISTIKYDAITLFTGHNSPMNKDVLLYPNPAREYFNLSFSDQKEMNGLVSIKVTDITGRNVFNFNTSFHSPVLIDCSFLNAGIYTIEVYKNEINIYHDKFLIN